MADQCVTKGDDVSPTTAAQMPRTCLFRLIVQISNAYRHMLAVVLAVIGPRAAYQVTGLLARALYRSLAAVRGRATAQCRAALREHLSPENVSRVAESSFIHRVWNLTDLMLADRYLHAGTCHRFGGQVPQPYLQIMLNAQQRRHPIILLTAYYGSFDLLPVFLGYNGIRAGIVYRPHGNSAFDKYRQRIRRRSGCEMIPVDRAAGRLSQLLEAGDTVAIVADHHARGRGVPVTFLGLPTLAMKSVALLAQHYSATVAVAGIRRLKDQFRFEIEVSDVFGCKDWEPADDPIAYITSRYLRGLERIILRDPSQYLWVHARWGEESARRLTAINP